MSLPKYKEIENVTTLNDLDQEIFVIQKDLFDLRLKRSTSQAIKPHLFKHAKRRLHFTRDVHATSRMLPSTSTLAKIGKQNFLFPQGLMMRSYA